MITVVIIGAAVFGYALLSERLETSIISGPMVFVTIGIIVSRLGQIGRTDSALLGSAVEVTLALLLFTDAARIDVVQLRKWKSYPSRLLGIGLPLTVAVGALAAWLVFDKLLVVEAVLLAAAVAPTDAALGEAVVSDTRLPVRIRQSLNVESGLNDGIAVPVVTVALAIAAADLGEGGFLKVAFEQIGYGALVGGVLGAAGTLALHYFIKREWVTEVYRQLGVAGLILAMYGCAALLGGSGFIACYVGGLTFGILMRQRNVHIETFASEAGQLLSNATFLLFGAVMVRASFGRIDVQTIVFVVLALTVARMLPVWIAMTGTGALPETKLFMGWFGPRGLASILFALEVAEGLDGPSANVIADAIVITIVVSVYAHGITANPWVGHLAARLQQRSDSAPELQPVHDFPTRLGPAEHRSWHRRWHGRADTSE